MFFINKSLETLLTRFANTEGHHSSDLQNASLGFRLFLMEFLVTALVPILVMSPAIARAGSLLKAFNRAEDPSYYSDFQSEWCVPLVGGGQLLPSSPALPIYPHSHYHLHHPTHPHSICIHSHPSFIRLTRRSLSAYIIRLRHPTCSGSAMWAPAS